MQIGVGQSLILIGHPKKKKSKFFFLRETRSFAQSCDAPRTATVSSHRKSVGGGGGGEGSVY